MVSTKSRATLVERQRHKNPGFQQLVYCQYAALFTALAYFKNYKIPGKQGKINKQTWAILLKHWNSGASRFFTRVWFVWLRRASAYWRLNLPKPRWQAPMHGTNPLNFCYRAPFLFGRWLGTSGICPKETTWSPMPGAWYCCWVLKTVTSCCRHWMGNRLFGFRRVKYTILPLPDSLDVGDQIKTYIWNTEPDTMFVSSLRLMKLETVIK